MLERKNYIDYIKAIGVLLVIGGHINFANDAVKGWIYSFHMPLFFFASGLTVKKEKLRLEYIHKKVMGLIVPYVIWSFIYSGYSLKKTILIGWGSRQSLEMAGSLTSLWFLPVLFLAFLFVQFSFQIGKFGMLLMLVVGFWVTSFAPELPIGYPWGANVTVTAALFIMMGYLCEQKLNIVKYKGVLIICILITILYKTNKINKHSYIMMATNRIGNPVLFFVVALGGCLGIYGIANVLDYKKTNKYLLFLGQNSLLIMMVHKPFIEVFKLVFDNVSWPWQIQLVISTLGTVLLSVLMVMLINKFARFLRGNMYNSQAEKCK